MTPLPERSNGGVAPPAPRRCVNVSSQLSEDRLRGKPRRLRRGGGHSWHARLFNGNRTLEEGPRPGAAACGRFRCRPTRDGRNPSSGKARGPRPRRYRRLRSASRGDYFGWSGRREAASNFRGVRRPRRAGFEPSSALAHAMLYMNLDARVHARRVVADAAGELPTARSRKSTFERRRRRRSARRARSDGRSDRVRTVDAVDADEAEVALAAAPLRLLPEVERRSRGSPELLDALTPRAVVFHLQAHTLRSAASQVEYVDSAAGERGYTG